MRTLEWLLLVAAVLTILSLISRVDRRARWLHLMPWVTAGLFVAHLVVNGYRWQLEFLYGFLILLLMPLLGNLRYLSRRSQRRRPRDRRWLRRVSVVLGLAIVAVVSYFCYEFPMFTLPTPSGPHAIGTEFYYLEDITRPDEYTLDYDDHRKVSLQVWYPAEPEPGMSNHSEPVPYLSADASRYMARGLGLPSYMLSHFALIPTHTHRAAKPASDDAPYPVVLYSPSGLMTACVALAEEMASQGYVFIAVGHPHWNPYYFDSNGDAVEGALDDEFYEALRAEITDPAVEATEDKIIRAHTQDAQLEAYRRLNRQLPRNVHDVRVWAQDMSFVLDQLEAINTSESSLAGKLDLNRVGVVGFSKGGCAAGQVCLSDDRVGCGVNLDGFMYGDIVESNLTRPFMFVHGEAAVPQAYITEIFYERCEAEAYRMKVWGGTPRQLRRSVALWRPIRP